VVKCWFTCGFSVGSHVVHYRFTRGSVLVQLCCMFVAGLDHVMLIGSLVVQY